jgi:DNA polymerase-3 subunit delta'
MSKYTWQTVGFDKIKGFFERMLENGQLSHAYVFSGQEMIGKRTFALELARLTSGADPNAINPDVLFVDSASSESGQTITVEEIRRIKNFVSLSPYIGSYKFVVINDAHLMTTEAQNALLKVLEEPSPSSILILVTANPTSLLPTIVSRCQEIKFLPHPKKIVDEILKNSGLPKTKIEFLAEFSNGRVGLVKMIIKEKSFDEVKDAVEELMRLVKADINERFTIAQKLGDEKNKPDLAKKVLYWLLYARMRIAEPRARGILRGLTDLHGIITQPQFNHRLALENFVVSL